MSAPAVLITSASAKVPLVRAAMEAAGRLSPSLSVVAGDVDPLTVTSFVADDFWLMPRTSTDTLESLLDGCRERQVRAILPTRDGELAFWAEHREAFADAGIFVIVSDLSTVELCLDKLAFAGFGASNGLPLIPAAQSPGELGCERFVVKERFGAGSHSIGIGLSFSEALSWGARLDSPIYQPFVEGEEISIDAWADDGGAPKGLVLRRRDKIVNGEAQVTTTFRDQRLEEAALDVLSRLKLRGPLVMQAIVDAGGNPHVIECNTRFGGASTASIAVGLDTLYWSFLEATGGSAGACEFRRSPTEIRQVRTASDLHVAYPDL